MSTPHTKEPWPTTSDGYVMGLQRAIPQRQAVTLSEADYRRASACVNALAGLNPEAVGEVIDLFEAALRRIELENKVGPDILSAWLPDAHAALAKLKGDAK